MNNTSPPEKEPLLASERFRVALATVLVEIGLVFLPALGVQIDPDVLQAIAVAIAGIASMFIYGRTQRNTPT